MALLSTGQVDSTIPVDALSRDATSAPSSPVVFSLTPITTEQRDRRHRDFLADFVRAWRTFRGGEYRVIGGRDGAALSRLLHDVEGITRAEWCARVANAMRDDWFRRCGNVAIFCSRWSNYESQRAPENSGRIRVGTERVIAGVDPSTGQPIYRERA